MSINSGLFNQTNTIEYNFNPGQQTGGGYYVDPTFIISTESNSWVIPIEATTAVRVLWVVNITAGFTVEIAW